MATVVQLPSGRFRAFARASGCRDAQVFDRKDEAVRWVEKTAERMRSGAWRKVEALPAAERGIKVSRGFTEYLTSEEWLDKGDITRKVELGKQKPVLAALGTRVLTELTPDDVREYIALRRKAKPLRAKDPSATMSGHQIRLEVAALSSMCEYAITRKWLVMNPCKGVKRPKGDRRQTRLTDELIGAILQHEAIIEDAIAFTFFRLLFTTVCRPGELAGARKEWLRADPPQICLPRTKNEDARNILIPAHLLPLVQDRISQQGSDCPYIFGTRKLDKSGWSRYNYATPWRKVADQLNLRDQNVVPYLARHEGISRLFERTKLSDGQIAGLSGHRSAQALWHYKHLRNEHQRPIVDAMDRMVSDAIDRAITSLHPSKGLKPGEFLESFSDTKDASQAEVIDLTDPD